MMKYEEQIKKKVSKMSKANLSKFNRYYNKRGIGTITA